MIEESIGSVEKGALLVSDAGLVTEIGVTIGEQELGIGQINDAINQLDQVTQQNAALVEESASAAALLEEQARQLTHAVALFRLV